MIDRLPKINPPWKHTPQPVIVLFLRRHRSNLDRSDIVFKVSGTVLLKIEFKLN